MTFINTIMKNVIFQLIILIGLSIFITFYQFNHVPKNLNFDEVEFTKLSLSLQRKPYVPYSELATGHSTLYFYVLLGSFKLFGINNFALRFPSALFGILNVIIIYLIFHIVFKTKNLITNNSLILIKNNVIARRSRSNPINIGCPIGNGIATLTRLAGFARDDKAFILAFIFLSLRWYFNFSRFAFEATFLLFLELCSLFFLLKVKCHFGERSDSRIKHSRFWSSSPRCRPWRTLPLAGSFGEAGQSDVFFLLLSGLFAGLAFNSYTPGRIFFLVPLFYLFITKNKTKILPFLISFIILTMPLSFYLIRNPDIRVNQQSFLTNNSVSITNKFSYLGQNIVKTALMFNVRGDVNGRHNYPLKSALNPLIGILFLVGLIVGIHQRQNKTNQLFLIYFIISLIPTLLTYPHENPHMLRTFTVIPSIVYFIVLGLQWLTKFIPNQYRKISIYIVFMLLILSAIYEIRTYFYYQNQVFKQAFEIKKDISQVIEKDSL